ncbi:MAG: lasso RiPP family leader peptide-containing protein [Pseudonocardiaceae bacterium]
MTERLTYEAPALVEIGSLHELTLTILQKNGVQSDALTPTLGLTGQISLLPN